MVDHMKGFGKINEGDVEMTLLLTRLFYQLSD